MRLIHALILASLSLSISSAQTTAIVPVPMAQFFDNLGNPLNGGKLYSYAAGTSTPQNTYTDAGGFVPNTNPVILDAGGRAIVRLSTLAYKFTLTDRNNVQIWTVDNVLGIPDISAALANMVTTNTTQTITADKTFSGAANLNGPVVIGHDVTLPANEVYSAGTSANHFYGIGAAFVNAYTAVVPGTTNTGSVGTSALRFNKLWTTDLDSAGTAAFNNVTISGSCTGAGCGGGSSGALPTTGGTMTGDILVSGTVDLGSSIGGFDNAWLNTINSQAVRVYDSVKAYKLGVDATLHNLFIQDNLFNNLLQVSYGIDNTVTAANFNAVSGFQANGTNGASATVTVRNSAGTGTCTLTFSYGLFISSTC